MAAVTRRQGMASALGAAGVAALGVAGLPRDARAQAPGAAGRKVLVGGFDVGPGGFPNNFNPLAATAGFTWFSLYYEPLAWYDVGLTRFVPGLAREWDQPDPLSYRFRLQPDARWQDGRPFTSADVAWTFELAKDGRAGSVFAGRLGDIVGVDAPDAQTAVVRLSKPNTSLLDTLARVMMLPRHAMEGLPREGLDRSAWWTGTPVGTGPFRFVRYETDQFVELAAHPEYWRGKPLLDGVINRYFKTTAGAVAAQKAGEIQFTYLEPDDLKGFQGNASHRILEGDSWVVNYLGFNTGVPYWRDVRVRQACMHALNRDAIVKSILAGAATVANCAYVAPNVVPGDLNPYPYDPARARALLKEAGWQAPGTPIPLLTYYNSPLVANLLAAMQAMFAQVGIPVAPRQVDVPTYNGIILARDADAAQFPLVYAGAINGPDPAGVVPYLHERSIPPAGNNAMRVRQPDLNAAFDAAQSELDQTARMAKWQEAARVQNRLLPWGFLWVTKRFGVVGANVRDFVWTPAPSGGGYDPLAHRWSLA